MFDRTADPIFNIPVYKRIAERAEANRIWELVRQASEGNG